MPPLLELLGPHRLEPNDHIGTEPLGPRTRQGLQSLGEISRGNPLEVQPGDQFVDRRGAPEVRRQDRGVEAHRLVVTLASIAYARLANLQWTGSGLAGLHPGATRALGLQQSIRYTCSWRILSKPRWLLKLISNQQDTPPSPPTARPQLLTITLLTVILGSPRFMKTRVKLDQTGGKIDGPVGG